MHRLWVTNDMADSLTAIDPTTGADGERVRVSDPYNMYFTPDGKLAMVIAEAQHRFDLARSVTMKLVQSVHVDCAGLDPWTSPPRQIRIATCEFSGELVKVDSGGAQPVGYLRAPTRTRCRRHIRLSPDGRVMYVADMMADGAHVIDPVAFKGGPVHQDGRGTHGIVVGRGGPAVLTSAIAVGTHADGGGHGPQGRSPCSIPITQKILATWPIPTGGSPDMGGLSADGKGLWVSGRVRQRGLCHRHRTRNSCIARIRLNGAGPRACVCVPQPGTISRSGQYRQHAGRGPPC
jgi:hypothetical protein